MKANDDPASSAGTAATIDALAMMVTVARHTGPRDALTAGMQAGFGMRFDTIIRRSGMNIAAAFKSRGIPTSSPAAQATLGGAQQSIEEAVAEFYRLIAGSVAISARLLDRLAAETGRNPDDLIREIAKEANDA